MGVDKVSIYQPMEANLMKPFITLKFSASGKKLFSFQYEGTDSDSLWVLLEGRVIVAYSIPWRHSFKAAWMFRLFMDNNVMLEFSSACTKVVDWEEVGSLNIRFVDNYHQIFSDDREMRKIEISATKLCKLEKIFYEDNEIISECALAFSMEGGGEIIVATGISPSSVSVSAPFEKISFEPEFSLNLCKRIRF